MVKQVALLTAWGLLDGWDRPYVITYVGEYPLDLIGRFQIFGEGTVVFRRGDIRMLSGNFGASRN